ncbi:hypothetical protein [Tepidibacter aestuarii]|uniref:hypothetical protein n=1 Tax=Tepidibacter aestuarii TaxID=2925782 RepID=UPI0020C0BA96|nr:hypothetical protein [Tepidibacter aestuarii]CAH2214178.1 conserved membrane protein of unknown function [Tepidibacter aestuarii]
MKEKIKSITYIVLNSLYIVVMGFSLMIYTSLNKNLPWYESCGTQFLAIPILSVPILLVLGICLKVLSKKYAMSSLNIKVPFYTIMGMFLPLVIDGGLSKITIAIGTFFCVAFVFVDIYAVIRTFKSLNQST